MTHVAKELSQWESLDAKLNTLVASGVHEFEQMTIDNARQLLKECRVRGTPVPDLLSPGLWPTISVHWKHSEVEVFACSFEFYSFAEGSTVIHEYVYVCGESLPEGLFVDIFAELERGDVDRVAAE